jgi:hypothetical protein
MLYGIVRVTPQTSATQVLIDAHLGGYSPGYVVTGEELSFWQKVKDALVTTSKTLPGQVAHEVMHPSEWPSDIARQASNLWRKDLRLPFFGPETVVPLPSGGVGPLGPVTNPIPEYVTKPALAQAASSASEAAKNIWPWAVGAGILGALWLAMAMKASPAARLYHHAYASPRRRR